MNPKEHIVAITALIKNREGTKVLIVKRSQKEIAYPGKWAFPGGKVERGQSVMETLRREVKEEVGLDIGEEKHYLDDYTFIRPDGKNVVGFCFMVNAINENVTLSRDFEAFRWVFPEELSQFDHIEGMKETVKKAFNG